LKNPYIKDFFDLPKHGKAAICKVNQRISNVYIIVEAANAVE